MKKSIKSALMITLIVAVLLLSVSSIQAMDADNIEQSVQDDASVELSTAESEINENSDLDDTPIAKTENDVQSAAAKPETPVKATEQKDVAAATTIKTSTYDKLEQRIADANPKSVVELKANYKYNSKSGDKSGIWVTKDITIKGNGKYCIDGNGAARGFYLYGEGCKVTFENVVFKNCYCKNGANGAAVYVGPKVTVTFKNCVFKNNKVYNSNGAAIYGNEFAKITVKKCKFYDNTAVRKSNKKWTAFKRGMSSAILVNRGSTLNIYDSTFKNNKAYVGTIVVVSYNDHEYALSKVHVKNCVFEKNTARGHGVMYLDEYGKGTFENSVFKNNKVSYNGCILMMEAAKYGLVKNCKFEKNSAPDGAINLGKLGKKVTTAKITGCKFIKNKATYGAGIYSNSGYLTVVKCKFISNVAKKSGGAISTDNKGSLKVYNSVFKSNSAIYGGAIFSTLKKAVSSHNTFSKNKAKKTGDNVFGRVYAKISKVSVKSGHAKLKVKLTSPWKILLKQKFRLTAKGSGGTFYSKVLRTNSKGVVTGMINQRMPSGTYKVSLIIPGIDLHFKKLTLKV